MNEHAIIALSMIGFISILCQWLAWRLHIPAIIFLLLAGIVLGPTTQLLNPSELFGDLFFPLVSLAVAVILFEGSLGLKFEEIRGVEKVVRNILTTGVLITWVSITIVTHYLVGFDWALSILFGALMVVTGPTVIVPILRTVKPNATISNILRWEGIVIDPLGAILAVLVFEVILSIQLQQQVSISHIAWVFAHTIFIGGLIGAIPAYLLGLLLRHHIIPEYLHNVTTLAVVFTVFSISNWLSEESGLLAVTIMGIWLGNMKHVPIDKILHFKESLSILLISGLFIILAARLDFDQFQQLGWSAVLLFLSMQFIVRPAKIFISTIGSTLTWQEKVMISWIGPRGIVAAAVSALFALRLQETGHQDAILLVPLAFSLIFYTVIVQGLTAKWLAQRLEVALPNNTGFLIIGANIVARTIAKAIQEHDFKVIVTDNNWDNIKMARMEGVNSYYGNAMSLHADRNLNLVGINTLLALSPQSDYNLLASQYYSSDFGSQQVYTLLTDTEDNDSRSSINHNHQQLFYPDITFSKLASLLSQGAKIKHTTLSDNFSYEDYQQQYGRRAIPLFAFNEKRELTFFTCDQPMLPTTGWTISSLIQE